MKSAFTRTALICITTIIVSIFNVPAFADFSEGMRAYKDKNYERAMAEFKRSAVLGHKPSQFNIGIMYYHGEGVPVDLIEAYAWLALSATDRDPNRVAARDAVMSKLEEKDKDRAIDRMQALAKDISVEASKLEPILLSEEQCSYHLSLVKTKEVWKEVTTVEPLFIGNYTLDVEFNVDKHGAVRDYSVISIVSDPATAKSAQAFPIYELLRRRKYLTVSIDGKPVEVVAVRNKFRFQMQGSGLNKKQLSDYAAQLRKSTQSKTPTDLFAAAYLGDTDSELMITKDETNTWYYQAAQSGYSPAQYQLGKSLFLGDGCKQDGQKALQWLTMAAEEKSIDAQYFLGVSLLGSDKLVEDRSTAIKWLNKAASGHHEKAMMRLAWILATDRDEKVRDPQRAMALINEVYKDYPDRLRANETLAAVQAANGEFDEAVKSEKKAIREAKSIEYPLDEVQSRFAAYQSKQRWLE